MTFADQLKKAKGDLTARQVASAVSPLLSVRTVEDWLADRRSPPEWTQDWIISRVQAPRHDCAPVFTAIKFPKKPRKKKGQNESSADTAGVAPRHATDGIPPLSAALCYPLAESTQNTLP